MKKILVGVGIFFVIAIAIFGFLSYETVSLVQEKFEAHKPELKQYITMNIDEQNAYVEKNLDFLIETMKNNANDKDKKAWEQIKNSPEAKAAGIEVGRSIIAMAITSSEDLSANLQSDIKSKFEKEAKELEARFDKFSKIAETYEKKK